MNKIYQLRSIRIFAAILSVAFLVSCGDDEDGGGNPTDDPIASFQFEVDGTNIFQVTFTNFSENATTYSWDFGDGNTSTEENPVHTYAATGSYNVTLTALNGPTATSQQTKTVNITDPFEELRKLTGDVSKTWRLIRDVSTGDFPLQVGPEDRSAIWWALGDGNNLGDRPCILDDNYIFSFDGTFEFQTNGDTWADGGVWAESAGAPGCVDSTNPANMVNINNEDISAWGDGTHAFDLNSAGGTLTLTGLGAYLGLAKAATSEEVVVPQTAVTYNLVKLTAGDVDTLIVETTVPGGYWRMVFVHYDNPAMEPPIPGPAPETSFTTDVNGFVVTLTNTSTDATSYSWDFGDGNTSNDENPVHTYAECGTFTITLTATNANGSTTATEAVSVGANPTDPTAADLHGGSQRVWRVVPAAGSVRVGSSQGAGDFFSFPEEFITDRACFYDDEFIIKSDGTFDYDTKGAIHNDGFLGGPTDCVNDGDVPAPFDAFTSTTGFTYSVGGAGPVTITVNGVGAFLGFAKGFNGGEINAGMMMADLPTSVTYEVISFVDCGTSQTLDIAVDIAGDGTAWWSMQLESVQ